MEREKIEIVLTDMFDELKTLNNNIQEQKQQTAQLREKICDFEERENRLNKSATPVADIKPIATSINTTLSELKQLLQQQSKPIIREWRFLLFPANYSKEYYTVVFRLIMWMTLVCIGSFLFSFGSQALENSKEVKLIQLENAQYKNAWQFMYDKETKQGKKKMDDVWNRKR